MDNVLDRKMEYLLTKIVIYKLKGMSDYDAFIHSLMSSLVIAIGQKIKIASPDGKLINSMIEDSLAAVKKIIEEALKDLGLVDLGPRL